MGFFKSFFASLLALIVFFFLSIFIISSILVGLSMSPTDEVVEDNSVLCIPLEGSLVERSENNLYAKLLNSTDLSISLQEILTAIDHAKTDPMIKGIYLKPGVLQTGYASLEEIRLKLKEFKSTGKFIVAYSGSYTQGGYYVSSVADSIFLNPQGVLDFRGVASSSMFYKQLLDTLGVEMQVIKVGTYKSFTEQYTNDTMSAPNREQTEQLVGSLWTSILKEISNSRNLSIAQLNALADKMMAFQTAHVSLENHLVDALKYADEVRSSIQNIIGLDDASDVKLISARSYCKPFMEMPIEEGNIAVLYAVGEIDNGNTDGISSSKMVSELKKIKDDSTIKALVVRVNSPGGSAYGAEQIWHAIERVKEKKPVVVSMGDYAASGGYYLSAGADYIFADEKTITGSIGVFSVIPNLEGLMKKVGVSQQVVRTNAYSDVLSNFLRPLDDTEKMMLQGHTAEVYDVFLTRCSEGRNLDKSFVETIAEGRVWSGVDAKEKGLVDAIGSLSDAVVKAAEMAQISYDDCQVVIFPKEEDWMEQVKKLPHVGYEKLFHKEVPFSKERAVLEKLQQLDIDQAMMPYSIEVR